MKTQPKTPLIATALLMGVLFLSGCYETTQTTSGADYLANYSNTPTGASRSVDAEVMEVAAIEPNLRFPARIGIAKIFRGELINLSETEATAWQAAREDLGDGFGEFVPVSPLIAELVYTAPEKSSKLSTKEVVRKIRLAAARQHLDVVLIYEVFSQSSEQTLSSSITYWTIIGAYFVPGEKVETVGYANALLLDVRNGYPYGTAAGSSTMEDVNTLVGSYDKRRQLEERSQIAASLNLIPEAVEMFQTLKEKRTQATAAKN